MLGHAVVGEHHGHRVAAQLQLTQRVEGLAPDSARTTR